MDVPFSLSTVPLKFLCRWEINLSWFNARAYFYLTPFKKYIVIKFNFLDDIFKSLSTVGICSFKHHSRAHFHKELRWVWKNNRTGNQGCQVDQHWTFIIVLKGAVVTLNCVFVSQIPKIYSAVVECKARQLSNEQKSTWQVDTHMVLPQAKYIDTSPYKFSNPTMCFCSLELMFKKALH